MTAAVHHRRAQFATLIAILSRIVIELRDELRRLNSIGLDGDSRRARRQRSHRVRRELAARHRARAICC